MMQLKWNPPERDLRIFAVLQVAFFAVVAALLAKRAPWVWQLFPVSVLFGVVGAWRPELARPVYRVWMTALFPLGWVMSHVLLSVVYLLVVTPLGIVMRWRGLDPLMRKPTSQDTYWRERLPAPPSERYFRQF